MSEGAPTQLIFESATKQVQHYVWHIRNSLPESEVTCELLPRAQRSLARQNHQLIVMTKLAFSEWIQVLSIRITRRAHSIGT